MLTCNICRTGEASGRVGMLGKKRRTSGALEFSQLDANEIGNYRRSSVDKCDEDLKRQPMFGIREANGLRNR